MTVLGVDLDASTRLNVGAEGYCGGGSAVFTPRPYAPPPAPMGYYPSYEQTYAPPPPPPMAYSYPCGCVAPPRW